MFRLARTLGIVALLLASTESFHAFVPPGVQQKTPATDAACVRTWLGHEAGVEDYLRVTTIARVESVPIGVTRPKRGFFPPGGLASSIAWKPLPPGRRSGYWESYKSEIAAYELDKLLKLGMVPPAVERTFDGAMGAAVLWIEPVTGWNKDRPVTGPQPEWNRQVSRMKLFDQLIANIDRNQGNLLYDADWHLFLIDHSRAFTDRTSLGGIAAPTLVDRVLWDRITALTREDVQTALDRWLDGRAIDALFKRRDLMRKEIEKDVARRGDAAVFLR